MKYQWSDYTKEHSALVESWLDDEARKLTVMEYLVDSGRRNLGLGSSALCELMESGPDIIGSDIGLAEAVIFPNNKPSQRAFEKAGFRFSSADPDGDAWYYRYERQKI